MERAVFALLCLSAAFCLASSQIPVPDCPEDYFDERIKYTTGGYQEVSQDLLEEKRCRYDLAALFPFYFADPTVPYYVVTYITTCQEGFFPLQVVPGVYICEVDGATVEPGTGGGISSEPPTEGRQEPVPTGELPDCPTDGPYRRENYVYSSQSRIVKRDCILRIRIQSAPSQQRSSVWVCKPEFVRTPARRNQFSCERPGPATQAPATTQPPPTTTASNTPTATVAASNGPSISVSTEPPTTAAAPRPSTEGRQQPVSSPPPTEATSSPPPTEATTGGPPECPSGPHGKNNYVYSSLSRIVEQECFIRIRIQGAPAKRTTSVWVCGPGYVREPARRNQFRCEPA